MKSAGIIAIMVLLAVFAETVFLLQLDKRMPFPLLLAVFSEMKLL